MRYRLACVAFACSLLLPEASSFCMQRVHHVKRGRAGLIVAGLSPATLAKPTLPYDWTRQWYAVDFVKNVPSTPDPMPYAVFGHSLVLWRDETGTIRALEDRCPHRAARLSEGQVRDGRIECSYHGWQFDGTGTCVRIPQLEANAKMPAKACVTRYPVAEREGVVWVWMSPETPAAELPPPPCSVDDLDANGSEFLVYDFLYELPYDASFLVENLLDYAHIDISHDRTPGGGFRENAQPFDFEVDEPLGAKGFSGRYRKAGLDKEGGKKPWVEVLFEAPGIVRNRSERGSFVFSAALHCMPVAPGRSRLLFRVATRGLPRVARWLYRLRPGWLRHLNSCKILEQDVGLIATQEDVLSASKRPLRDEFLPLRSSDALVVAYRRWLDAVGEGMPWAVGWGKRVGPALAKAAPEASARAPAPGLDRSHRAVAEGRYTRHVLHSRTSREALGNVRRTKQALAVAGVCAALVSAAAAPGGAAVGAACVAAAGLGGSAAASRLERCFYESFDRRTQLRERGRAY